MKTWILLFIALFAISGCTVRGVDTTLRPQLMSDGQVVYVYSDLANFALPDQDAEAEKLRVRDLNDWVNDSGICPSGYDVIKRQPVAVRAWAQGKRVYYFIKCRT